MKYAIGIQNFPWKRRERDFTLLPCSYIGVMSGPNNEKTEKIAMTAPVVNRNDE